MFQHTTQGSVATRLRSGGLFNDDFIAIYCWVWRSRRNVGNRSTCSEV